MNEGLNHLGEREYQTYGAWQRACMRAGATRFEGDRDIANAFNDDTGKSVGEWGGDLGTVFPTKPQEEVKVVQEPREEYDDEPESHEWDCGACGGPVYPMGRLGSLIHGRCQSCGMDQSHDAMGESVESVVAYFLELGHNNMKTVSEAFRPFRVSSPQRPFKMPDWASPEKSSEGRKLRDVFSAPKPKTKEEPVQPKAV